MIHVLAIALLLAAAAPQETTPLESIPETRRPSIKSWVEGSPKEIGLGETVVLRAVVKHGAKDTVHLPAGTSFGTLDLVDKSVTTRKDESGRVVDDHRLTLIALAPGESEIPAFGFMAVLEGGEVVRLDVPARRLSVRDPTAGVEDPVLKDIVPPVDVYQDDYTLLYVLGALAGLARLVLCVGGVVVNWARWPPRPEPAPPPPRPPEEIALEKLRALQEGGMPPDDRKKEWYIGLSEIVREYMGLRYDFDGLESTTEEIVHILRGRKTHGLTQAELFRFLNDCDMVKFAKYLPTEREDVLAIGEAFRIVQITTPEPPRNEAGQKGPRAAAGGGG